MSRLLITINADDPTDLDFIKHRCIGAVEDVVETVQEEGRFDGNVSVEWDQDDD